MIFSELYGSYYNAVAEILRCAVKNELTEEKLHGIVFEKAFGESVLTIPQALKSGKWQLLLKNYETPLKNQPQMPMTTLEKRWLKSLSLDPRVQLFDVDFSGLDGVEPLFSPQTVYYFDRYADGDDFTDLGYISRFRAILLAIKRKKPLKLGIKDRNGRVILAKVMPERLEYSEKDDKFRLITSGCKYRRIIKLSTVVSCQPYLGAWFPAVERSKSKTAQVTFRLFDGRNTLERAMLHFAHFEKRVEKIDENLYEVVLNYDADDETEILIRILSFGPFLKVVAPETFVNMIKERLKAQKKCGID